MVSIRLPKPEAALAQLCFEESLFLCSEKDSDLEVDTRESRALESHGHLGQQTATGSQGPGRALIREPFSPGFMGGVSRASAMVCIIHHNTNCFSGWYSHPHFLLSVQLDFFP